jgi:hypothetical protein
MGEWISVDERLPEASSPDGMIHVLVWCNKERDVFKGVMLESESGHFWGCYPGSAVSSDVTHWMPLPEPPSA